MAGKTNPFKPTWSLPTKPIPAFKIQTVQQLAQAKKDEESEAAKAKQDEANAAQEEQAKKEQEEAKKAEAERARKLKEEQLKQKELSDKQKAVREQVTLQHKALLTQRKIDSEAAREAERKADRERKEAEWARKEQERAAAEAQKGLKEQEKRDREHKRLWSTHLRVAKQVADFHAPKPIKPADDPYKDVLARAEKFRTTFHKQAAVGNTATDNTATTPKQQPASPGLSQNGPSTPASTTKVSTGNTTPNTGGTPGSSLNTAASQPKAPPLPTQPNDSSPGWYEAGSTGANAMDHLIDVGDGKKSLWAERVGDNWFTRQAKGAVNSVLGGAIRGGAQIGNELFKPNHDPIDWKQVGVGAGRIGLSSLTGAAYAGGGRALLGGGQALLGGNLMGAAGALTGGGFNAGMTGVMNAHDVYSNWDPNASWTDKAKSIGGAAGNMFVPWQLQMTGQADGISQMAQSWADGDKTPGYVRPDFLDQKDDSFQGSLMSAAQNFLGGQNNQMA